MNQAFSRLLKIALSTLGCLCATGKISLAQVTPDNTVNTQVNQSGNISEITGGETRGSNLFHSFEDFSVPTSNEAFFNNAESIGNIFSRVTGGNVSSIDGAIRANGAANLFLINPAGIVFGANASLNIGGSFFGSTADSILFPDGEYSALQPESESVLTVEVPIGLGFASNPGEITNSSIANDGRGLEVAAGNNITLVGGNVKFEGGSIFAPDGTVNLGGLSTAGIVNLNDNGSLSFPSNIARADLTISNGAGATVAGERGGNINLHARNAELIAGDGGTSGLVAGIIGDSTPIDAQAGEIMIDATNKVTIDNSSVTNVVDSEASGSAGDVIIDTSSLSLTNGGIIGADTFGQGNAGSIKITANDTISIDGENSDGVTSLVSGNVAPEASGNAGDVTINTGYLSLTNGGIIAADTFSQGNAGAIEIVAEDTISIDGENSDGVTSLIGSTVRPEAVGDAEEIIITTNSLSLANGGQVSTSTFSQGNAGAIKINVSDTISIDGERSNSFPSLIDSTVQPGAVGEAKDISITTNSLSLTNGGRVVAGTLGQGNAGSTKIMANDTISIAGESLNGSPSFVSSGVGLGALGNAGSVIIDTGSLSLTNGGEVSSSSLGRGNAGLVEIAAKDTISIDGARSNGIASNVGSTVQKGAVGDAEDISITTNSLSLNNGGRVAADTFGQGNAGSIEIMANDAISIDGTDSIDGTEASNFSGIASTVQPGAVGDANDISITTNSLSLAKGGRVTASTFGQGNAGAVKIDASNTIAIDGGSNDFPSSIDSTVSSGAAGNANDITITANSLSIVNGGQVSTSTFGQGNAGAVKIDASNTIAIDGVFNNASSGIFSTVEPGAVGDAEDISITTNSLSLTSGSQVIASTFGRGNAGVVEINASDTISVSGQGLPPGNFSAIGSQVGREATGDAGGITINANSLSLAEQGLVTTSTFGQGNAGSIDIMASDTISIDGGSNDFSSGIFSTVEPGAVGNAENISITTNSLSLTNRGRVAASTFGQGNAGQMAINANSLSMDFSLIEAATNSGGGNIDLRVAEDLTLKNNSIISALAVGDADGGNLSIDAKFIVASPNQNNDLIARAEQGTGGNINIVSSGVFGLQERSFLPPNSKNDIDASSELGVDGTVNLNTNNDFSNSFELIIPDFAVAQKALQGSCFARRNSQQGSFVYGGTGGLPVSPDLMIEEEESFSSRLSRVEPNLPSPNPLETTSPPTREKWQIGDPIVEPTHLVKTKDGRLLWVNKLASRDSLFCQ